MTLQCGDQAFVATVQTGDGYMCRNESVLFFGLGDVKRVDHVTIRWPSGSTQVVEDVIIDARMLVVEGEDAAWQR